MNLRELDIVAVDFETTGTVKGQENIPWQIGCAALSQGVLLPDKKLSLYLNVPQSHHFNPYTPGRWAEIREQLSNCNTLISEWPTLAPWLTGHCLAAHNVPVERSILNKYFPLHKLGPWIDTLKIARLAFPGLQSYTLTSLLEQFSLLENVNSICKELAAHDAYYDAVGCAVLLQYFISLPGWENVTVEMLQ